MTIQPMFHIQINKKFPKIAIQLAVDKRVGVYWNQTDYYFSDQFILIDSSESHELDKLIFGFLLSDFGQIQLQLTGYLRTRTMER